MITAGLVHENLKSTDKRRILEGDNLKGHDAFGENKNTEYHIDIAIGSIINEATQNLWEAIKEWEFLFDKNYC